jgi:hypothetical protein
MSSLDLLIRLSRRTVEERQVTLSQIGRAHAEAVEAVQAHDNQVTTECRIVATDPAAHAMFGQWAAGARRRGTALRQRCADLARAEQAAQDALQDAFTDLKRLELALEAARESAAFAARRRAEAAAEESQRILGASEAA